LIEHTRAHRSPCRADTSYLRFRWNSSLNAHPLYEWIVKLTVRQPKRLILTPSSTEEIRAQSEGEARASALDRISRIQGLDPKEAEALVRLSDRYATTSLPTAEGLVSIRIYENIPRWILAKTTAVAISQTFWDTYVLRRD
jgi:hypothetical protein